MGRLVVRLACFAVLALTARNVIADPASGSAARTYIYQPLPSAPPLAPALTGEEQALLTAGEIPADRWLEGAVVSNFIGFGVGQALQRRWTDIGWVFTFGEAATVATVIVIAEEVPSTQLNVYSSPVAASIFGAAILSTLGLRIWESVDAWTTPLKRNHRVRALRARLAPPVGLYVAPTSSGRLSTGLSMRF
jgi:hypothetical protein